MLGWPTCSCGYFSDARRLLVGIGIRGAASEATRGVGAALGGRRAGVGSTTRRRGSPGIRDEGVSGVLWIAGDFHWGALATVGRPGDPADDMWEVFCGPGGSGINPLVFLINADDHYRLVVREHNYVAFECDPMAQTIQLAFIGDDGAVIETETLQF